MAPRERTENRRRQATIRWTAPDSVLAVFVASLREYHAVEDRALINGLVAALGRRSRLDPLVDPTIYPAGIDSLGRIFARDEYWRDRALNLSTLAIGVLGYSERYTALLDSLEGGRTRVQRAVSRVGNAMDGRLPHEAVTGDLEVVKAAFAADPTDSTNLGDVLKWYHHAIGDHATARQYPPMTAVAPRFDVNAAAFEQAVLAFYDAMEGNEAALDRLQAAVRELGWHTAREWAFAGYWDAVLYSRSARHRPRAIRMLRWQIVNGAPFAAQSWLALARTLDEAGDTAGALEAWTHVLRFWDGRGPFRQPDADEAKRALVRLGMDRPAR